MTLGPRETILLGFDAVEVAQSWSLCRFFIQKICSPILCFLWCWRGDDGLGL